MAVIGVTAKLEHESGSSWATVPNCKSVNFPSFSVTSVDTTHLGITDFGKTYMPGMIDAGTITFECEYTSAVYAQLQGLIRDVIGWRVSSPTDALDVVTCDGFLTKIDVSLTPDEEVMLSGEIKCTGVPVIS